MAKDGVGSFQILTHLKYCSQYGLVLKSSLTGTLGRQPHTSNCGESRVKVHVPVVMYISGITTKEIFENLVI